MYCILLAFNPSITKEIEEKMFHLASELTFVSKIERTL
jgi:hypothetical protein